MKKTIGVFINTTGYTQPHFLVELYSAFTDFARKHDVTLLLYPGGSLSSPFPYESNKNILYDLVDNSRIDGLIICSYLIGLYLDHTQITDFLNKYTGFPVISIGIRIDGIPSLIVDNKEGIHSIFSHLVEVHNYRKIAMIRGPATAHDAEERFYEYIRLLEEFNLPFNPDLIAQSSFNPVDGSRAMEKLLKKNSSIDAVIAANDDIAMGAIGEITSRGLSVPGDIAVVGFDNSTIALESRPALTTVSQPGYTLGQEAIRLLYSHLTDKTELPEIKRFPTKLIVRESCGCRRSEQDAPEKKNGAATSYTQTFLNANRSVQLINNFTENMEMATNLQDQLAIARVYLPLFGIEECYIVFYSGIQGSQERARLIFSLKNPGIRQDQSFLKKQLLPDSFSLKESDYNSFIISALFYGTHQIGYMVFNFVSWKTNFYEALRKRLSSCFMASTYIEEITDLRFNIKDVAAKLKVISGTNNELKDRLKKVQDSLTEIPRILPGHSVNDLRIQKALQFIKANYTSDIGLNEVAEKVYIGASYFSTIFKKETGQSFLDYLSAIRIHKAEYFLKNTSLKINQIASMVGFNDPKYFTRVYKKKTGMSPQEYRDSPL